jgi:hypothetical protein
MADLSQLVGSQFAGRFLVERLLGKGGMGAVYLCRHEVLGRPFALKLLHRRMLEQDDAVARFRREARAASAIEHPNVTYVYDFGHNDEGWPYLVMEYVEGTMLAETLAAGRLPMPRVLSILVQTANALAAAHERSVVHRDLKPQNIALTRRQGSEEPLVKVLDFGLAKFTGALGKAATLQTARGQCMGTPAYMSPEQCAGDPDVDVASDVYSFGIVAFELLTGSLPFLGSIPSILGGHIHGVPPRVSDARSEGEISPALDALVERCLTKKPGERPRADELADELTRLLRPARRATAALYAAGADTQLDENAATVIGTDPTAAGLLGGSAEPVHPLDALAREVEQLAFELLDRGLGSSELALALADERAVSDRAMALESSLDLLRGEAVHHEIRAREREGRLRRLLVALEREKDAAAKAEPTASRGASARTVTYGKAAGLPEVQLVELCRRIESTGAVLRELWSGLDERLSAIEAQVADSAATLSQLHDETRTKRARLLRLVEEAGRPLRGRVDGGLTALFARAGLWRTEA